jgi:tRNA (guanine37-N1)-methyltransferase
MKLKHALKGKLTKEQFKNLITSFDIIGDIAIIEIPRQLEKKEKQIAGTLLKLHRNIKVVCKKTGIHAGTFRRQKLKIIAGERRKTTLYKENNVIMKLHIQEVYFSPRLSHERLRIAKQVKPGESVLIMFSGVAPYCLVIARNTKAKEVYGIEINPLAHKFALENIKLNKLNNIKLFLGDARLVTPSLNKKFDRIAMPLPKTGENFLDVALAAIKPKGIVHFYDFKDKSGFGISKQKIKQACALAKKKCKILRLVKCGQTSPRTYRICVDFTAI